MNEPRILSLIRVRIAEFVVSASVVSRQLMQGRLFTRGYRPPAPLATLRAQALGLGAGQAQAQAQGHAQTQGQAQTHAQAPPSQEPNLLAALLPLRSVAGRALVLVLVIMTFLASLSAGSVFLIAHASAQWSDDLGRELTVQIRPVNGRPMEADLAQIEDVLKKTRGLAQWRVLTRAQSENLLTPWLGEGLDLSELPVPRLIVIELPSGGRPDLALLKTQIAAKVPNASLDDHRLWLDRLRAMAGTLVGIGVGIFALVLTATALAVVFATRGAMAGTAQMIEVLHMVGAEDRFIARQFGRHFLHLGLIGGGLGALGGAVFFGLMAVLSGAFGFNPDTEQVDRLFGRFDLSISGYLALAAIGVLVAALTAFVSRVTVYRTLSAA